MGIKYFRVNVIYIYIITIADSSILEIKKDEKMRKKSN